MFLVALVLIFLHNQRFLPFSLYWGAKSGDIDHLNPVESDHLLSGAN